MKDQEINILLQANYHKGVSDGILMAMNMIRENAAEIERTQENAAEDEEE